MKNSIDITFEQKKIILDLLERYIPDTKVWAYGSRVRWTAKPSSDLDIVAFTTKEQEMAVRELKEAFKKSDLSLEIDFRVWYEVQDEFREYMTSGYSVLQEKKISKN